MAIRVERPSRTFFEQIREAVGNVWSAIFKFGLWILLAIWAGYILGGGIGAAAGSAALAQVFFIVGFLGVLGWRYGRPFYRWALETSAQGEKQPAEEDEVHEEAPAYSPDATLLGYRIDETGPGQPIALEPSLRNRHVYAIGKTRTGKTTLLKTMFAQDIQRGAGAGFIDPHGDAALELLGLVPPDRVDDVIYLDPTQEKAPSFNPFQLPYAPPKLAEDFVSVFRMLVGSDSWGPRMEHLLRFGTLTLLVDREGKHTLAHLRKLFIDPEFRNGVIARIENPQLLEFWEQEFPTIPESAANPILNKLSAFLSPMSDLERVFSKPDNDLDFSAILNGEKILIINLAKGVLGDEPSRLLGGLIVAGIQQAALARASLPSSERLPFYLYVDEFQNFTVSSFESILSESAKYQLNLTLANQNLGQLSTSLQRSIFGNCATLLAFQVSADDAPHLQREMHRSRIAVRPKGESDFYTLESFVEEQRDVFTQALNDKYLGMNLDERRKHRDWSKSKAAADAGFMAGAAASWVEGSMKGREMGARRAEIQNTLDVLSREQIDSKTLRELFPEWEFRETSFPETDDFLNIPPHHAFCRIGRADDVTAFEAPSPLEPDPMIRDAVLERVAAYARGATPEAEKPTKRSTTEPESFFE